MKTAGGISAALIFISALTAMVGYYTKKHKQLPVTETIVMTGSSALLALLCAPLPVQIAMALI